MPLTITPIPSGQGDLPFAFDIAMGVKPGNDALRARVQDVLDRRRADIAAILKTYAVPVLEAKVTSK